MTMNGNGALPGANFPSKNGNGNGNGHKDLPPELSLPAKIRRGNLVQSMQTLPVILNGYNVSLKEAVPKVYLHELKFMSTDNKDKEKDLTRGPRNDVSNILRHEAMYELFMLMLNSYPQDFHLANKTDINRFAYDCGINLYSADKLMNKGEEKRFLIDVTRLSEKSRDYLSQRIQKIEGILLATEEIDLRSTTAISQNLLERDRSVIQFLEVLSSQHLYNKESFYMFRQKMFEKQSQINIRDDPRIIKSGMQKNVRFIGESVDHAHPFLQIDPKKSAFYAEMDLLKYLGAILRCGPNDIERRLSDQRSQRQIARDLKGLVLKTTHLSKNTYFTVHNLTEKGANQIFFEMRDGQRQSVSDYFETKHHFRLRFPTIPCIIEKRVMKVDGKNSARESYYPMEVLKIHDGQRITRQKMTPKLTEEMIRNCQLPPSKYRQENEQQRAQAFLSSGEPHFKAFGVKVDPNIRVTGAEILFPPAIQYGNELVDLPGRDRDGANDVAWQINRKRFLQGCQGIKVWVAMLFQRGIHPNVCNDFVQQLIQNAKQMGMDMPPPAAYEEVDSTQIENCRQKLNLYKTKNVQYILFFTRDKLDPVHNVMKLLEVEFGIPSQHVSAQTVEKATSGRGAQLVYGNVLQKMNMKLGGVNHDIVTASAFQQKNKTQFNVVKDIYLKNSRMFIGIDMSHASPQSLYERQSGIQSSEPTIVGMAYTVGKGVVQLRGTYWCQTSRVTVIENLADKIATAIQNYNGHCGNFPTHLVVYRSGVSDGEIAKVMTQEQQFFKDAYNIIAKQCPDFQKPSLTIVAVQRGSNYRIIPQNIDDRAPPVKQNCPSGTVVDREVINPSQTEFLLIAQKAIQGTAQPSKCNVVYDDCKERMSLEELEYITYHLCFGHIVTSPVSVPAVLYSAGDLAKRGRNNWKEHSFGSDSGSVISGGDAGSGRFGGAGGDPDYFVQLSESLKPIINTKFWA